MTDFRYGLTILVLFSFGSSAAAGTADFARGRVLLDNPALVQRATLPQDVYEWVVREDLGDLRVFNGTGEEVPYALRRPPSSSAHSEWQSLPVFPLPEPESSGSGAEINIELDDGGTVVAVQGANAQIDGGGAFLIDASRHEEPISEIEVDWRQDIENVVSRLRVEASNDLDQWTTLIESATLAALETEGQSVKVNRIPLNAVRSTYLKLTTITGTQQIPITHIRARSRHSQAPERHWKTLPGTAFEDGFDFDTGGLFAIDRVTVELDRDNYLIEAQLYSRDRITGPWQDRGLRTFYRVTVAEGDTQAVNGEPISYATTRDRYWRVEPTHETGASPALRIGWLPDELVFLRQGPPPFTLAYGRADTTGRPWPVRDLLTRLDEKATWDDLPVTGLGEAQMLGGPDRLVPQPEPIDWQTILLWSVLVAGVAGVGLLAFRLARGQRSA